MLVGDLRLATHLVFAGVVNGDFGGEIFRFEDDGGSEVGEGAIVGHAPLGFHGLGAFPEEGLVAFAANEGEVLVAAGLLEDDLGEFLLGVAEFLAGGNAFGLEEALLDELGAAGLDREVGLSEGDLLLGGIAVLGDEVAPVAGEHDVGDLTLAAGAEFNHFVDVNKMVLDALIREFTGGFGLVDDLLKISPFCVAEEVLKVAGEPVLDAVFGLLSVAFEGFGEGEDLVGFHELGMFCELWMG